MYRLRNILTTLCIATVSATQAQIISTVAGNHTAGYSGDGGSATSAQFNGPAGIAVSSSGNIYIADQGNNVIRKISSSGIITTIAGTGTSGYSGDGGPATSAKLNQPSSVAVDAGENVYITDDGNNIVRRISSSGTITTIAGIPGTPGYSGDGGPASSAYLRSPGGICVDIGGNIYVADVDNDVIRKIKTNDTIVTLAGSGLAGFAGDGGPAIIAKLNVPKCISVDGAGSVFIADQANAVIRKVNSAAYISTVAGTYNVFGYSGDGGFSTDARLNVPAGVANDATGSLYICDYGNNRVRKVSTFGVINTIAGTGVAGYTGDGSAASSAQISSPYGVAVSSTGRIYFTDRGNHVVRMIQPSTSLPDEDNSGAAFTIAPNPNNGTFSMDVPDNNVQVYISDVTGRAIATSAKGGHIVFAGLLPGIYAATIVSTTGSYTKKVVVQ